MSNNDFIFIMDNLHEKYMGEKNYNNHNLDIENKPGRPYTKESGVIDLKQKNFLFNNICVSKQNKKTKKNIQIPISNSDALCTYGGKLVFLGNNIKSKINYTTFWSKLINQIKDFNKNMDKNKKKIFYCNTP